MKKDLYELVLTADPKERLQVVNFDDTTEMDKVEYVIGIGINKQLAGQGYGGLEVYDLIKDLIYEETDLDNAQMVELVLPKFAKQNSNNNPVFKYLSQIDEESFDPELIKYAGQVRSKGVDYFANNSMRKKWVGRPLPHNLDEVCSANDMTCAKGVAKALQDLAFVPAAQICLESFKMLLVQVWETYDPIRDKTQGSLTTHFRRAVRIYDWLKYGNKKTPEAPKGAEAD